MVSGNLAALSMARHLAHTLTTIPNATDITPLSLCRYYAKLSNFILFLLLSVTCIVSHGILTSQSLSFRSFFSLSALCFSPVCSFLLRVSVHSFLSVILSCFFVSSLSSWYLSLMYCKQKLHNSRITMNEKAPRHKARVLSVTRSEKAKYRM